MRAKGGGRDAASPMTVVALLQTERAGHLVTSLIDPTIFHIDNLNLVLKSCAGDCEKLMCTKKVLANTFL